MPLGAEQNRGPKSGRRSLLEFGITIGAVDADADHVVRAQAASLGRANRAEHGVVVHADHQPAFDFGMLRQQNIHRIKAAGNVGGFVRRFENSIFGKTGGDQRLHRAVGALLRRVQFFKSGSAHRRALQRPAAALHFFVKFFTRQFADLARRQAEIMHVLHERAVGADELIVHRHEFHAVAVGFGFNRRTETNVRRTNHKSFRAVCREVINRRQRFLAVHRADFD